MITNIVYLFKNGVTKFWMAEHQQQLFASGNTVMSYPLSFRVISKDEGYQQLRNSIILSKESCQHDILCILRKTLFWKQNLKIKQCTPKKLKYAKNLTELARCRLMSILSVI